MRSVGIKIAQRAIIERLAEGMALLFNGGDWRRDYTEKQRELWRQRACFILDNPGKELS